MTEELHSPQKGITSAKIIADTISPSGVRMTTMELEFHRWILAELNTHRMLSKNGSSSRAIPFASAVDLVMKAMVKPVRWGLKQPGMSAKDENLSYDDSMIAESKWNEARQNAIRIAEELDQLHVHKQWVVRLLEPFTVQKMLVSGTEWSNFFWLRDHEEAQPEFQVLAGLAKSAYDESKPIPINEGEWHLPYYRSGIWKPGDELDLETARNISVSCCAQTSYRKNDTSIEKAEDLRKKFLSGRRIHASPFEHQATPIKKLEEGSQYFPMNWEPGVTHMTKDGSLWSGNLQGFVQYRQLIPGHVVWSL